jgi:hypothetical protein
VVAGTKAAEEARVRGEAPPELGDEGGAGQRGCVRTWEVPTSEQELIQ